VTVRRRKPKPKPSPTVEWAICVEEFRTGAIGNLVERWQRLPLDHPLVRAHPSFFRGLVKLEEVNNAETEQ
jgi:hypothetical protein